MRPKDCTTYWSVNTVCLSILAHDLSRSSLDEDGSVRNFESTSGHKDDKQGAWGFASRFTRLLRPHRSAADLENKQQI